MELPEQLIARVEVGGFDDDVEVRRLVDALPLGVLVRRGPVCLYANQYAAIGMGFASPEELVGFDMLEMARPDVRDALIRRMQRVDAGERAGNMDTVVIGKDGVERTIQLLDPRPITFGGEPATLVVAREVTRERALERRLVEAEQGAILARLSGGLSHEINNPLSVIMYALTTLTDRGAQDEIVGEALVAAQRIVRVVRDVALLGRTHEPDFSETDVARAVDHAIQIAGDELRYRAVVVRDYVDTRPVRAPEGTLARAFLAILLHSVARLPRGHAREHQVRISIRPTGSGAASDTRIVVEDDGDPVTKAELEASFEPFTSTTAPALKTGLGLAVCRQILENLGGTVHAEPLSPRGARFEATLPAAKPASGRRPIPTTAARVTEPLRVLLVDDDPALRRVVRRMLQQHEVTECGGGREALDVLAGSTDYDIILTDVMMPDLGGTGLFEQVRVRHPDLAPRVMFMTGGAFSADDRRVLRSVPAARILSKPFQRQQLLDAMADIVGA